MRFSFVGDLHFNTKDDAKVPAIKEVGDTGLGINATVVASKNNRAFVEALGWQNDTIKTKDIDNGDIEVSWEDRFDEEVVKQVANYRKNVIVVGDDRHEFISTYDFCEYIKDHMDEFQDKRFVATGQTQENFYKGKESKRFLINSLYEIDKDDERKNKLEMSAVVSWSKDSIDTSDFKEEKKIYVNAYTSEFLSKKDLGEDKGGNRYIPIQLVLDCSKIDFDNEKHLKMLNYRLMNLGLAFKDGKIVNSLKSGKYYTNEITISYFNGAQDMGDAEEITYDMLTSIQKMKVDLGLAKPEDFAAKGRVFGDRIIEFRITDFSNKEPYQDGFIEFDGKADEFEDLIFIPSDDEEDFMPKPQKSESKPKKSEAKPKKKAEPEPEPEEEDDEDEDIDDLFG